MLTLPYTWCLIFWLHWQLLWSIPHALHHLLLELNIQHYPLMLFWRQPRIFTHQNTMRKKRKIIGPSGLTVWPFDSQPHFPILKSPILDLPPNVGVKCLPYWARERTKQRGSIISLEPATEDMTPIETHLNFSIHDFSLSTIYNNKKRDRLRLRGCFNCFYRVS